MKQLFFTLLVIYVVCILILYLAQRKLMYFPTVEDQQSQVPSFRLTSGDLQLKIVLSSSDREKVSDKAILYFPGNAENVWWTPHHMQRAFSDFTVYYLNYPGYGGSSGEPGQRSILKAASDLYAYVKQRHSNIAVVGRSLGTGVAMHLASQHPVSAMVLISPYDSIAKVAAVHYPIFPVKWLLKDKFDSQSRIGSLQENNPDIQILVLTASEDKVVPPIHSDNLTTLMRDSGLSVKSTEFAGYQHNNIAESVEFNSQIQGFLMEKF